MSTTPIYYVIVEYGSFNESGIMVYHILKSIACDVTDLQEMYEKHVRPLYEAHRLNVTGIIFYREPDNPFKERTSE